MGDQFVLKERQKLQAKEKELAKREEEAEKIKQRNAELESELKSKNSQLDQTADLLRRSNGEKEEVKREMSKLVNQLKEAELRAKEAERKAAAAGASEDAQKEMEQKVQAAQDKMKSLQKDMREKDIAIERIVSLRNQDVETLKVLKMQVESLTEELKGANDTNISLSNTLSTYLLSQDQMQAELRKLREQLDASRGNISNLQQLKDREADNVKAMTDRLAGLQRDMTMKDMKMAEKEQLLEKLTKGQEELAAAKSDLSDRLRSMDQDLSTKQQRLTELQAAKDREEEHVKQLQGQLEKAEKEITAASNLAAALQARLDAATKELAAATARITQMQKNLDERMRWIESLETTQRIHRARIDELWTELQALQKSGEEAQEAEHEERLTVEEVMREELEGAKTRVSELEGEITVLEEERQSLQEKVLVEQQRHMADIKEVESQLTSAQHVADQLKDQVKKSKQEANSAKRQVRAKNEKIALLKEEVSTLEKREQNLTIQLEDTQEQLAEKDTEVEETVNERLGDVMVELEEKRREVNLLKEMVKSTKTETKTKAIQNAQMRKRINGGTVAGSKTRASTNARGENMMTRLM